MPAPYSTIARELTPSAEFRSEAKFAQPVRVVIPNILLTLVKSDAENANSTPRQSDEADFELSEKHHAYLRTMRAYLQNKMPAIMTSTPTASGPALAHAVVDDGNEVVLTVAQRADYHGALAWYKNDKKLLEALNDVRVRCPIDSSAAGLTKMRGLLRSGFEVSKFPTSGAPRIRVLWMHPEGKLVLGKAVDGADAAKAIMLEHISVVRVGTGAPNFSSSSKAQREAAGNEAACLSIHGSAAEPSFHIRLATPGSADVLASKLLDMQREFVRADYNATMRRAQAISYARAGSFLPHELLQTLRGQTKGHADMEDTVKVTALNPASDADMEAVAAVLQKAAAASAPAETQKERNMRIYRATPSPAAGESV